jgi:hypothetical protein
MHGNWFLKLIMVIGCSTFGIAVNSQESVDATVTQAEEIEALKAEVERLRSIMPAQAVAMTQVAYNFSNLWFAVQEENWPLAQFYWNETRVRARWAIRVSPTRRLPSGEVAMQPYLEAFEEPYLAVLGAIIADKNSQEFASAYDDVLEACYSCHVASEKPYLRLSRPERPAEVLIDFAGG